ncbi:MAG: class I SAM-dependent methyltransferase [Nitrososphaerales archaeon]
MSGRGSFDQSYFEGKLGVYEGGYYTRANIVRHFYRGVLRKFRLKGGKNKKALDVGCAYGYGVEILAEQGYDAYGCDVSEYAVRTANTLHNWSRCFVLNVEKETLPLHFFDLVTLINTIEHFKDPESVINNVKKSLKRCGVVLVATNNPWSPLNLRDRDPTHQSVFSPIKWYSIFRKYFKNVYVATYITSKSLNLLHIPFFGYVTLLKATIS